MFGLSHLFASIGGFVNLIAGVSAITLFEFCFFFFVKVFYRLNKVEADHPKLGSSSLFTKFIESYFKSTTVHGMSLFTEGKLFWFVDQKEKKLNLKKTSRQVAVSRCSGLLNHFLYSNHQRFLRQNGQESDSVQDRRANVESQRGESNTFPLFDL